MFAALTVVRYPPGRLFFAILAMALFRLPLWLDRRNYLSKLMGSGRNGSFDIQPDLRQWAVMVFRDEPFQPHPESQDRPSLEALLYGKFISGWWRFFKCETWTVQLRVCAGHGTWDGKTFMPERLADTKPNGPVAVLTRATIRLSRLRAFWSRVPAVSKSFFPSPGLILSLGIGEVPFTRQATFSIWNSLSDMQAFAYKTKEHREVIARTKSEGWYSEEMFLRFDILDVRGTIRGQSPFRI